MWDEFETRALFRALFIPCPEVLPLCISPVYRAYLLKYLNSFKVIMLILWVGYDLISSGFMC